MDQTTLLVVAGSFQTSYADDVVTASNGPACTSASANPGCAAATSAWALTTSGRSDAPASACSLDCASTGGAAGAATLTLSVRRRPMDARSPVNEVSTWFLAAIRSTWAAARAACACSTSALAVMPARTCASACRTCDYDSPTSIARVMCRPARAPALFDCATARACGATATDGCCDSAELTAAWRVTGTWASAGPADVATTASDMTRIKTRRVHTFTPLLLSPRGIYPATVSRRWPLRSNMT